MASEPLTIALMDRGCRDDGDQEGDGACEQRDAPSNRGGSVGRTAVGVCCHGGGVLVACGVRHCQGGLGNHLLEEVEEEEDGGERL